MIEAKFDIPKLERSLKKAAKAFGDTTEQAVARWSVQTGRELAGNTQVKGKGTDAKKKQWAAIEAGARSVIWEVTITGTTKGGGARFEFDGKKMNWPQSRVIKSASEFDSWIDENRTGKNRHTKGVNLNKTMICDTRIFKKALKNRQKRAGMAKGAWLGSASKAATFQRGGDRINIGKNFMGWAQKHSRRGTAKMRRSAGFKPSGNLINRSSHSSKSWVLSPGKINDAVSWALRNTVKWYRGAANRALKK